MSEICGEKLFYKYALIFFISPSFKDRPVYHSSSTKSVCIFRFVVTFISVVVEEGSNG